MKDSPGSLELLSIRVDDLEKRVHALEHLDEARAATAMPQVETAQAANSTESSALQAGNLFPTLGRAMLGIAGAYVLRAVAAAGTMPKTAVAAVAIAYAFAWLVWAGRVSKMSSLPSLVFTGTSALILGPMLWEVTLHFQVFSPAATATVLGGFVIAASVIAWRDDSKELLWVTYCAAVVTAVALAVAVHQTQPFLYVLLLIALLCELERMWGRIRPMWSLVALVVDGAIWGTIFIYNGPPNARADYPDLSMVSLLFPAILLFAIYGTSVAVRVMLRDCSISVFETMQAMITFLLAVSAIFYFAPVTGTAMVGIVCLVLAAAGYWASFRYLRGRPVARDFRVFSMWSAALFLGGMLWLLPQGMAAICLAIAAPGAYAMAGRIHSRMLELHGASFLVAASMVSMLPQYVFGALASATPQAVPTLRILVVAGCAIAAYAIAKDCPSDQWQHQALSLIPALVAACALAALTIHGLLAVAALAITLDVYHVAFLRTLVISSVAMCLAFVGSRFGRLAMTRLAYVALVFVAAKLFFEDLRHGRMEFIAGSLFLFAITLIAVPRLVRAGAKKLAAHSNERTSPAGTVVLR